MYLRAATVLQSAARAWVIRRDMQPQLRERRSSAACIQRSWRALHAHRASLHAAIVLQSAARARNCRRLRCAQTGEWRRFFTIEPLRVCGHHAAWKVGIGDLTKQLSILHNVGTAAGLSYVHSPLASGQQLARPHRGSCSVSDIDIDAFLGVGTGEASRAALPPLGEVRVGFDGSDDDSNEGFSSALSQLRDARGPCLVVLVFSYRLLNSPSALSTIGLLLDVAPARLRCSRSFGLQRKYWLARSLDGFSCGWRPGCVRLAVHVRRGDRAYVEVADTLYCMHRGLWTAANLGRTTQLDGTLSVVPATPQQGAEQGGEQRAEQRVQQRVLDGIRARAPPAALIASCVSHVHCALLRGVEGVAEAVDIDTLILSDGYGEAYHEGFGAIVDEAFAAQQTDDWARLGAVPNSRLVVGNEEGCTRVAVDAMASAHVLIIGGGSHLPDACQTYLSEQPAIIINAWACRERICSGGLPERFVGRLRNLVRQINGGGSVEQTPTAPSLV